MSVINITAPVCYLGHHYPGITLAEGVGVELFINGMGSISMKFTGCVQENTPTVCVKSLTCDPIVEDTGCPDYLNLWPPGV